MLKLIVNLAIATWLFVSAFVLPHSVTTAWNSMLVAIVAVAAALFAFVSVGRPGTRYLLSVIAVWLFASTMFLPHESLGTVLHDALVAVVLAFVSLLPSRRWSQSQEPEAKTA